MSDAGIDYGRGLSNIDHETGIRYGVIHANSVGQSWFDSSESDYGDPTCPECGNPVTSSDDMNLPNMEDWESSGCADYACRSCEKQWDSGDVYGDDPIGHTFEDSEYTCTQGQDGDIFVIKSPYYSRSQFCSPCAPGAGYLESPCETGPKTYCLGHEWFEDNIAPYPVYRVSDDTRVDAPGDRQ
jgi:hypothetical protein